MSLYALLQKAKQANVKFNTNMGTALIDYVARESVQTYDYGIKITNLGRRLKKATETIEFQETLAQAGRCLSMKGKNVALVLEIIDNQPFIDWGEVSNFTKIGGELAEICVDTRGLVKVGENDYPLYHLFKKNEKGQVVKIEGYWNKTEFVALQKVEVKLPFRKIPAFVLKNNALGEADIPETLRSFISNLDWLSDEIIPEWVAASTQWLKNQTYGSTETADDLFENSLNHKKIHQGEDPDNKATMGIGPVSLGTQSIINLSALINYVEDKILKYSMQFREVGSGGTNKHNLEIASENKQAFEYMLAKLDWRERQLTQCLNLFQSLVSFLDDGEGDVKVTIEVPELEKYKMDNMQAQVDNLKAQTENQLGQAKSWEASAEQTEKGEQDDKQKSNQIFE